MPASIARRTESWFARHQRALPWRDAYDPYRVWVSEVMAQQTRMEVVVAYFERFVERFPNLAALANATDDDVTAAWSGLGYYRRARMLRAGAVAVVEHFGGALPHTVDELMQIPGIGRYTAGAIASIAFDIAAPIVDGNVARVLARLFADESRPWERAEELVKRAKSPRDFNQGLMEIGALICKPRSPLCLTCPLRSECATRSDALPLPKAKPVTCELHIPLYVITDRRGRVLMRRESGPLMNAMFHLPHGDASLFGATPLAVDVGESFGTFRHTITNRRITFEVFAARVLESGGSPPISGSYDTKRRQAAALRKARRGPYHWIAPAELPSIPHPSYVRKALRIAGIENRGLQFPAT